MGRVCFFTVFLWAETHSSHNLEVNINYIYMYVYILLDFRYVCISSIFETPMSSNPVRTYADGCKGKEENNPHAGKLRSGRSGLLLGKVWGCFHGFFGQALGAVLCRSAAASASACRL